MGIHTCSVMQPHIEAWVRNDILIYIEYIYLVKMHTVLAGWPLSPFSIRYM